MAHADDDDGPRQPPRRGTTLQERLFVAGMRLLADPRVARVASDERLTRAVLRSFQLRDQVRAGLRRRVSVFARTVGLATQQEVHTLHSTIRSLERRLATFRAEAERRAAEPPATKGSASARRPRRPPTP
jgi:hypothetical protein